MASKVQHLRQAKSNQEVCALLGERNSKYLDWVVTATYYTALHHVEAAFACISSIGHSERKQGRDESSTGVRYRLVKKYIDKDCAFRLDELRNASSCVRYLLGNFADYYSKEVVEDFIDKDLPYIITHASRHYSKVAP